MRVAILYDAGSDEWSPQDVAAVVGNVHEVRDVLRRRGDVDEVDQAIVQHRCAVDSGVWCRMYKDRECKRERSPEEIAKRAGLSLSKEQMSKRVDDFREKILDGLGRAFPDYNSCLNERKPDRGRES